MILGIVEHCWWYVLMCSKCNIVIAVIDPRANWRSNSNCIGCIGIFDFDNTFMDCSIFRAIAKGKLSTLFRVDYHYQQSNTKYFFLIAVRIIRHYFSCSKRDVHASVRFEAIS